MENKMNLINKFLTNKIPVEVLYSTAENDKYNFTVIIKGEKGKEYAVLFVNSDESFYTAEIIGSDMQEKIFSVIKLKIAKCERIRIVDIETEQIIFEADFKMSVYDDTDIDSNNADSVDYMANDENDNITFASNNTDEAGMTAQKNRENDIMDSPAPIGLEDKIGSKAEAAVKIKSIAEKDTDKAAENFEDKKIIPNEEYTANYEKDAAQTSVISDDESDYDIDLFMQDVKSPEISKSQKASLINDNEGILEELFEKFDLFETPLKNHVFYKLDEANAKKSALKIILNGFIVPVLSPLLEYKNPFGTSGGYPKYLIGETSIDGEIEYYVYGTLGRNLREEQPFSGATGFVYFEKIRESEEGYWLMYVNAKTGRISLPMRPKNI